MNALATAARRAFRSDLHPLLWLPAALMIAGLIVSYQAAVIHDHSQREQLRERTSAKLEPIRSELGRNTFAAAYLTEGLVSLITTGEVVLAEHKPALGIGPGRYAWLSVTDDGTGMSPEVRDRVFEPFFTIKENEGTGLGLASAYGMVTHNGGTITVESKSGQGAKFQIFLPVVA